MARHRHVEDDNVRRPALHLVQRGAGSADETNVVTEASEEVGVHVGQTGSDSARRIFIVTSPDNRSRVSGRHVRHRHRGPSSYSFLDHRDRGPDSPRASRQVGSLRRQPVADAGLGQQIARPRRLGLELVAQVRHVDAQVVRLLGRGSAPTPRAAAAGGSRTLPAWRTSVVSSLYSIGVSCTSRAADGDVAAQRDRPAARRP